MKKNSSEVSLIFFVVVIEAGPLDSPGWGRRGRSASPQGQRWRHRPPKPLRISLVLVALPVVTWVEVDSFVEVAHLDVARLLLAEVVGKLAEPFRGHPQQVDQLFVVRMVAEHLHQALDKPVKFNNGTLFQYGLWFLPRWVC